MLLPLYNKILLRSPTVWLGGFVRSQEAVLVSALPDVPYETLSFYQSPLAWQMLFFQMMHTSMWQTWPCSRTLGLHVITLLGISRDIIWHIYLPQISPKLRDLPGHMAPAAGLFAPQTESIAELSFTLDPSQNWKLSEPANKLVIVLIWRMEYAISQTRDLLSIALLVVKDIK